MENTLKLKVISSQGRTMLTAADAESVSLVYTNEYQEGDRIVLSCNQPCYCVVQFEDSLPPALIYAAERDIWYHIPFGADRIVFSPKCFAGSRHLIRARLAQPYEIAARRNLAFNPYDQHGDNGFFPHSKANVETRGEAVFASYNAIDGIYENSSHGEWPYQSWGINRDPKAAWTLNFGRSVTIDELRLVIRADFPHDNYWTSAKITFSDGSEETLSLVKTAQPQAFPIAPRRVEWLTLSDLIQAEGPSPFPALTQFEAWGVEG